jgi:acyl dehydratase
MAGTSDEGRRAEPPTGPGWERTRVGDEIPAFVRTTDLAHWNRYAAVNDEFIPIHMDPAAARAAGQPDVFGMGNLRISYLHAALHEWLAGTGGIVDFRCEFRGMNFKGDRLASRARVARLEERDGARLVHLTLSVENQDGVDTAPGEATVLLFGGAKGFALPEPPPEAPPPRPRPGRYLDQATLDRIGEVTAPVTSLPVGANDIRRWAMATWYPERVPLEFYDEDVAARGPWGGLVAPREFNPFAWMLRAQGGETWLRGMGTEPGRRVLNGGQRSRYFAPIRPGDAITEVTRFANAYEKEGGRLGTMLFFVNESRWTNQRGELVRIGNRTTIYY